MKAVTEQARWGRPPALAESEQAPAQCRRESELTSELGLARTKIAGLERSLAQETATTQALRQQVELLNDEAEAAGRRATAVENELNAVRAELSRREHENQSLQAQLDLSRSDNVKLAQRLSEREAGLEHARERHEFLQTALAAAEDECRRLRIEIDAASERQRNEANALSGLLEAMTSRALTAEKLFADARERLRTQIAENAAAEQRLAQAALTCEAADKRLKDIEGLLRMKRRQVEELEQSRAKLIDATNRLLRTFQNRNEALICAEERIQLLNARIADLQAAATATQNEVNSAPAPAAAAAAEAADDLREQSRATWVELARELARLMKHKRQLAERSQMAAASKLLASTIAF